MFFLDANRGINGRGFGTEVAALAKEFEIPTFLSCQAQEFSHEAMGLKQGIFTVVCLEALRSQPNLSLSKLQEYLSSRVPELSEHHWQPLQNPWTILPNAGRVYSPLFAAAAEASGFLGTTQLPTPRQSDIFHPGSSPPSGITGGLEPALPARPIAPSTSKSAIVPYKPTKANKRPRAKSRLMPISIGLVGTSIAMGVVFANFARQDNSPKSSTKLESGKTASTSGGVTPYIPAPVTPPNILKSKSSEDLLEKARKLVIVDNPDSYVRAIALGQEIPPDSSKYAEAQSDVEKWSKAIYQIANTYALKGDLKQAIDVAKLMPSKSPMYSAAQGAIRLWERQQAGKTS